MKNVFDFMINPVRLNGRNPKVHHENDEHDDCDALKGNPAHDKS